MWRNVRRGRRGGHSFGALTSALSLQVVEGSVEGVELPSKVDIIVSEPIGFLLVHERMLESFVAARNKFLKPGGLMMPTTADILIAPFTDDALFKEQAGKATFWKTKNFYGIDLSSLYGKASSEYMSQAIVGYFGSDMLISSDRATHAIDFQTVTVEELQVFEVPLSFLITRTAILHGLGCWFDAHFLGQGAHVTLTTSPDSAGTHWYQCRLLFAEPIAVNASQTVSGTAHFVASEKTSYVVTMELSIDGTPIRTTSRVHLQDQHYSYLSSGSGSSSASAAWGEPDASSYSRGEPYSPATDQTPMPPAVP